MSFWTDLLALNPGVLWKLNEAPGVGVVQDATANNRDGTVVGTQTFGNASKIPNTPADGSMLSTDAANGRIELADAAWMTATNATGFWACVTYTPSAQSFTAQRDIIGKRDMWQLWQETNGRITAYITPAWTGLLSVGASGILVAGTTYFIVLRKNSTHWSIWINGVKNAEVAHTSNPADSAGVLMAGASANPARNYRGNLQGFAYKVGLISDAEIVALYNSWIAPPSPPPSLPDIVTPEAGDTVGESLTISYAKSVSPVALPVTHDIQYSYDNGVTWTQIVTGHADNEYEWARPAILFGSQFKIRVRGVASDGSASAWVESGVFKMRSLFAGYLAAIKSLGSLEFLWALDDEASLVANDETGQGRHGAYTTGNGATVASLVPGITRGAYQHLGYEVRRAGGDAWQVAQSFTALVIFKPSLASTNTLMGKNAAWNLQHDHANGRTVFQIWRGVFEQTQTPNASQPTDMVNPRHYAISFSPMAANARMRIYVNGAMGVERSGISFAYTPANSAADFIRGVWGLNGTSQAPAFFSRELEPYEVYSLYQHATVPNDPPGLPIWLDPVGAGLVIDASRTLSWQAAVDPAGDPVYYDIDFWDGSAWLEVAREVAGTSYFLNTWLYANGAGKKLRIRATDLVTPSAWVESVEFEIAHGAAVAPTKPDLDLTHHGSTSVWVYAASLPGAEDRVVSKVMLELYAGDDDELVGPPLASGLFDGDTVIIEGLDPNEDYIVVGYTEDHTGEMSDLSDPYKFRTQKSPANTRVIVSDGPEGGHDVEAGMTAPGNIVAVFGDTVAEWRYPLSPDDLTERGVRVNRTPTAAPGPYMTDDPNEAYDINTLGSTTNQALRLLVDVADMPATIQQRIVVVPSNWYSGYRRELMGVPGTVWIEFSQGGYMYLKVDIHGTWPNPNNPPGGNLNGQTSMSHFIGSRLVPGQRIEVEYELTSESLVVTVNGVVKVNLTALQAAQQYLNGTATDGYFIFGGAWGPGGTSWIIDWGHGSSNVSGSDNQGHFFMGTILEAEFNGQTFDLEDPSIPNKPVLTLV